MQLEEFLITLNGPLSRDISGIAGFDEVTENDEVEGGRCSRKDEASKKLDENFIQPLVKKHTGRTPPVLKFGCFAVCH